MQTKSDVEAAFRAELLALLTKYDAELEAKDYWQGYAECGEDARIASICSPLIDRTRDV